MYIFFWNLIIKDWCVYLIVTAIMSFVRLLRTFLKRIFFATKFITQRYYKATLAHIYLIPYFIPFITAVPIVLWFSSNRNKTIEFDLEQLAHSTTWFFHYFIDIYCNTYMEIHIKELLSRSSTKPISLYICRGNIFSYFQIYPPTYLSGTFRHTNIWSLDFPKRHKCQCQRDHLHSLEMQRCSLFSMCQPF